MRRDHGTVRVDGLGRIQVTKCQSLDKFIHSVAPDNLSSITQEQGSRVNQNFVSFFVLIKLALRMRSS